MMMTSNHNVDVETDGCGFLVACRNKKKLLYDGLMDIFSVYGKIASISDKGNRIVHVRYIEKDSALKCYEELCKHPDFMVDIPNKFTPIIEKEDTYFNDLNDRAEDLGYRRKAKAGIETDRSPQIGIEDSLSSEGSRIKTVSSVYYVRKKRKIIQARAFKRFIISLSACNLYIRVKDDYENLLSELKYQMRGVSLNFETGFSDEIVDDSQGNEIPQLVLAKDFYYFYNTTKVNAVDVLICNLPPWYQEVDVYQLVLPLVPHDFLGIDWYRMYASGTDECSFPYCIVYLKTHKAACNLRYCADGLVKNNHKISVCLMDDVEAILLEVRRCAK